MGTQPISADSSARIRVRLVVFARLRELLDGAQHDVELPQGASIGDVWRLLEQRCPAIRDLAPSTRAARNGRVVDVQEPLFTGDEVALLPPVGGG